jgi:1,4-dihydroxy-2-naphthoate octaprenyltransferase
MPLLPSAYLERPRASSPPRKTLDVIEVPPFWKLEEYLVFALVLRELRARLVFNCLISASVSCLLFLVALGSFCVPLPLFALALLIFAYLCLSVVRAVIRLLSEERFVCISRTYLVRAFFFTPQFAIRTLVYSF